MSALFTRNRLIGLALAVVIAAVDQLTKWIVIGPLALRRVGHIDLLPFLDLTYMENRGISYGMLQATSTDTRWLLVAMTVIIAIVVLVWLLREAKLGDILGLGMILGGAIGNIFDRATLGYVVDFVDFQVLDYRPFAIFNVADAAITIGVVIILARSLLVSDKDDATGPAQAADAVSEK
ncbi:signal peptidase II [Erythrobacter sp. T5W1-R]|mgnify:CR=1 FL=1|uniref:signal peptidase II n=1 Tax=Erythrobacter sp. T5W1-R TaxID=3101752 RepID=UPI002AFE4DCB|nr:signal peptidase II [Erythrobacter sp. T5W1-R]MEA1618693.1 signal peptidase II [Erythrobacter sp. T5W1-R]